MLDFFKLIRIQNLVLIALMQLIVYFGFLKHQNLVLSLSNFNFVLLVFSTVLIAGAGYIINDIFDQDTDAINKPNQVIIGKHISEANAYNLYTYINIAGVAIGFYLSNVIDKPGFATLFIFIAALLYFYATTLKSIVLIGNFSIALVTSISVLIVPLFTLFPSITQENHQNIKIVFLILKDFAVFAFFINFIREIIKDCQDFDGDFQTGIFTLPVKVGIQKTNYFIIFLLLILTGLIVFYVNNYLMINQLYYATVFILIFILGPILYTSIEILKAKEKNDFKKLSFILKIVMFFSVLSLLMINYNIKLNVSN